MLLKQVFTEAPPRVVASALRGVARGGAGVAMPPIVWIFYGKNWLK